MDEIWLPSRRAEIVEVLKPKQRVLILYENLKQNVDDIDVFSVGAAWRKMSV